jgi:hypothetical protein
LSLFILNVMNVPKQSHSFIPFFRHLKRDVIFFYVFFFI